MNPAFLLKITECELTWSIFLALLPMRVGRGLKLDLLFTEIGPFPYLMSSSSCPHLRASDERLVPRPLTY